MEFFEVSMHLFFIKIYFLFWLQFLFLIDGFNDFTISELYNVYEVTIRKAFTIT